MHALELLAPAGSREALVAAVQNGADAVYLGGRNFNARRQAPNFNPPELERAVAYAHIRGVKVYVTINTIVADTEMEEAARFLRFIYEAGADAAIVQDIGLLRLARAVVPELALHASTQMTIHNSTGAALIKKAGVTRVILARELSLKEIATVKKETGMEVEVFVHGALCVCYSGQCLMSSFIGGRSGNRGMCAQPCRLSYALADDRGNTLVEPGVTGEFILSTRDLNFSRHLPDLAAAGVDALKIEGRMRRPEYVATVVRIYRKLIDRLAEGRFFVEPEEERALAQIFNRGFSSGYLFGRPGRDLMNYRRPNNRGVFLGRVVAYDRTRRLAEIKLTLPLQVGDVIEFWVTDGGRVEVEVRELLMNGQAVPFADAPASVQVAAAGRIRSGDRVFKTVDAGLIREAQGSCTTARENKKIPLRFDVVLSKGKPVKIYVEDPEGNHGEGFTETPAQPAGNRPLTPGAVREQLERLGNTPFYLKELSGTITEGLFVPLRELNAARRAALAALEERRSRTPVKLTERVFSERINKAFFIMPAEKGEKPYLAVSCGDLTAVEAALRAGADRIYFGGENFSGRPVLPFEDIITEAVRRASACKRDFFLLTPRISKDPELKGILEFISTDGNGISGVVAGNLGLIAAVRNNTRLPVWTDYYLNVFNLQSTAFLRELGVAGVTLSPELNLSRVAKLAFDCPLPVEVMVHGLLPLMVSEYCVVGSVLGKAGHGKVCAAVCRGKGFALRDRLGTLFPVVTDDACRMHILNSRELVMLAHLRALAGAGVAGLRIEARTRDAAYVFRVTKTYRKALDAVSAGVVIDLEKMEQELTAGKSFTRGHYFREADVKGGSQEA
ncbi:MAG: DUF3656 domain-containing protein [Bacillota bacterium]